jgi:hypothetical protein
VLCATLGATHARAGRSLELAAEGRALVPILLADEAIPAERTAARELAIYLSQVTSAEFEIRVEGESVPASPAVFVGPTVFAAEAGVECAAMGPEEWHLLAASEGLILCGGRPRGTLYAVYRFLEKIVGVRWWTPHEESVPRRDRLRVARLDQRGRPAFAYRDIHGLADPGPFFARHRINGHFSRLGAEHGGAERYGPPRQVHNFHVYVPPEEWFTTHPEFFSEIAGLRYGGEAQLCLTNPELRELVERRMSAFIRQSGDEAAPEGNHAPRLFDFSQNDWGKPCECDRCSAIADREGGDSGPLIDFLNQLAESIAEEHPDVLIDTLAYAHTFDPPRTLSPRQNIAVRLSALYDRNFAVAVSHPDNQRYLMALRGWSAKTRHLRIWDYTVTFGPDGDLPLPNLSLLSEDYRLYLDHGVDGIFVQHEYPIAADMRDLKLWVLMKLLEDPRQSLRALVVDFTDGYYGRAGKAIRRYLRRLETAAEKSPAELGYPVQSSDYVYLDGEFLVQAQAIFDRAERTLRGDPLLLRRVRHARISLDRATMTHYSERGAGLELALDLAALVDRYRRTWREQIDLRLPAADRAAARAEVEEQIRAWTSSDME